MTFTYNQYAASRRDSRDDAEPYSAYGFSQTPSPSPKAAMEGLLNTVMQPIPESLHPSSTGADKDGVDHDVENKSESGYHIVETPGTDQVLYKSIPNLPDIDCITPVDHDDLPKNYNFDALKSPVIMDDREVSCNGDPAENVLALTFGFDSGSNREEKEENVNRLVSPSIHLQADPVSSNLNTPMTETEADMDSLTGMDPGQQHRTRHLTSFDTENTEDLEDDEDDIEDDGDSDDREPDVHDESGDDDKDLLSEKKFHFMEDEDEDEEVGQHDDDVDQDDQHQHTESELHDEDENFSVHSKTFPFHHEFLTTPSKTAHTARDRQASTITNAARTTPNTTPDPDTDIDGLSYDFSGSFKVNLSQRQTLHNNESMKVNMSPQQRPQPPPYHALSNADTDGHTVNAMHLNTFNEIVSPRRRTPLYRHAYYTTPTSMKVNHTMSHTKSKSVTISTTRSNGRAIPMASPYIIDGSPTNEEDLSVDELKHELDGMNSPLEQTPATNEEDLSVDELKHELDGMNSPLEQTPCPQSLAMMDSYKSPAGHARNDTKTLFTEPLPPGWTTTYTNDGKLMYLDHVHEIAQFHHPLMPREKSVSPRHSHSKSRSYGHSYHASYPRIDNDAISISVTLGKSKKRRNKKKRKNAM
eukprot:CAMPEP_0197075028 /NCGR_PEP_ID=MMETSP1384-20130603/211404_1 /TAXON_ID=29189 /ORGANISM="Ammonia sp." /LENGTH=640 /DNA_ID=CAMNT_0042513871 /DNA_START=150 /DNA_END=2073 /DNA_ORIENTATION=-